MSNLSESERYIDVKLLKTGDVIDLNELTRMLTKINPSTGALVYFIGFVKGKVENTEVRELEYSAIDNIALEQLEKIAREEADKHGLKAVVIWHYTGSRKPGEITIIIASVSEDRYSAFKATMEILERVKREVPVFKLERRTDGEYWVIGDGVRYPRPH